MTPSDYYRICAQLKIIKDVLDEYGDRTLENAVQTLEARKKWWDEHQNNEPYDQIKRHPSYKNKVKRAIEHLEDAITNLNSIKNENLTNLEYDRISDIKLSIFNEGVAHVRDLLRQLYNGEITLDDLKQRL